MEALNPADEYHLLVAAATEEVAERLFNERCVNPIDSQLEQGQAWADLPPASKAGYLQEAGVAVDVMCTDGGSLSLEDPRQQAYAVSRITAARIRAGLEKEPEGAVSNGDAGVLALHHAELAQQILRELRMSPLGQRVYGPQQPWELYDIAAERRRRQSGAAPNTPRLADASYIRNGEVKHVEVVDVPDRVDVVATLLGDGEPRVVLYKAKVPALGDKCIVSVPSAERAPDVEGRIAALEAAQGAYIPGARHIMPIKIGKVHPQKYLTTKVGCYALPFLEGVEEFMKAAAIAGHHADMFKVYTEKELLQAITEGEIPDLHAAAAALLTFGWLQGRYRPDPNFRPDPEIQAMLPPLEVHTELLEPGAKSDWFPLFKTPDGIPLVHYPHDQAQALAIEYGADGQPVALHCCVEPFPAQGKVNLGFASGSIEEKSGYSGHVTAEKEAEEEIGVSGRAEIEPIVSGNPLPQVIVMTSSVYLVRIDELGNARGGDETAAERTGRVRIPFADLEQYIARGYFTDESVMVALMVLLARREAGSQTNI